VVASNSLASTFGVVDSPRVNFASSLSAFLKGAAMGAANVIPGVSGGTVAFITGIYERLINSVKSFDGKAIKLLFTFRIREFAKHTDVIFLALIMLGALTSILSLAKYVFKPAFATEHGKTLLWALFFGLIAASIPAVGKMVRKWGTSRVICALVGCAVAVSMAFLGQAQGSENFFYLCLCGVVAMCSMIIPGLSGSFVLLLMGNYELIMVNAVDSLTSDFGGAIKLLIPVAIGAVVGLIALSHFLSWLFRNYHDIAVSLIAGFIAGSLVVIYPWKDPREIVVGEKTKIVGFENWRLPDFSSVWDWAAIGLIVVGAVLVFLLDKCAPKKEESEPEPTES
jgi:putative membrane protein